MVTQQLDNRQDNQPSIDTTWILLDAEHDEETTLYNDGINTMKVTFIRHGRRDIDYLGFPYLPQSEYILALESLQSRRGCEVTGIVKMPPNEVWIYFKKSTPWGIY